MRKRGKPKPAMGLQWRRRPMTLPDVLDREQARSLYGQIVAIRAYREAVTKPGVHAPKPGKRIMWGTW
jgi:hypothetical protein